MMGMPIIAPAAALNEPQQSLVMHGTHGCHGRLAHLTFDANGPGGARPPGSDYVHAYTSSGVFTRQALTSAQQPKMGGGYWAVNGDIVRSATPWCSGAGR